MAGCISSGAKKRTRLFAKGRMRKVWYWFPFIPQLVAMTLRALSFAALGILKQGPGIRGRGDGSFVGPALKRRSFRVCVCCRACTVIKILLMVFPPFFARRSANKAMGTLSTTNAPQLSRRCTHQIESRKLWLCGICTSKFALGFT
ncbi:hypothetical protein B0H12DRAFT_292873 [Mycena haematopus]|nr:hypothetical protein B0H12DRAFT_292873 [Mycena haematopus]